MNESCRKLINQKYFIKTLLERQCNKFRTTFFEFQKTAFPNKINKIIELRKVENSTFSSFMAMGLIIILYS